MMMMNAANLKVDSMVVGIEPIYARVNPLETKFLRSFFA